MSRPYFRVVRHRRLKARVPFTITLALVPDNVTEIGTEAADMVIVAEADLVASATEVAFNVIVDGFGTAAGALKLTATPEALVVGVTVPQVAPVHPVPVSVHLTPLAAESLATVAVKACVPFTVTLAVVSDKVTVIGAAVAVTVIVADADFVVSATEVAFSVTVAGLGTVVGAL